MDQEMVGASHGWGFFCARHDRSLTALPSNQIEEVCNVAMTSSPHLEDCVVAIKFSGNQMSLCRPGRDLEWTNILTPPSCLENSNLMYALGFYSSVLKGVYHITKRFMVFREEETTEGSIMCYTEDFGNMCIFLANSEAFCVPASSCAGLKPNTIYHIMGRGLGFYDLTTENPHQYLAPDGAPSVHTQLYWLPPFST
ncbi:hypothetical protein F2Q69_00027398 [Brassica cretica]|uniref:DUF295 domain-containing protein n=1 Tax=Brassica cretica TaxID=69181 RepID=A0A8S9S219_BRACR|nr:hypothetical protein F2Q69_00027398 [Brassica cretica]